MTALFEMRIRVGGDPREFAECAALRDELAKLSHPACPDVDWARVEQLCLVLFQRNGADLQTAAAFALARSHRCGLDGMAQGIALIEALAGEWPGVWPPASSARLEILAWLFAQMQWLLRSLEVHERNLTALTHLAVEMEHLQSRLDVQAAVPVVALQTLRQQLQSYILRVQQSRLPGTTVPLAMAAPERALVTPVVILPAAPLPMPRMKTPSRRTAFLMGAVAATLVLASGVWWSVSAGNGEGQPGLQGLFQPGQVIREPVRLDSLSLFEAGSAQLKPDSTKVLISALADIKAQPGWLIVITGHTDASGSPEHNRQLSQARATAVRGWMQQMGDLPDSCFAVQGLAARQPVASNDTEPGRAANRRVDIQLVPQAGACGQPFASG
ncbi:OmpA family protein [Pseudomonas sp. 18173]|uniref:OmpA family protein n=1 Tax=Pseudomonas sp. 18173 TaxID=3390055 RepID=UPI003D1986D4